ncbi:serine/threonine-protein kinase [Aquabacterium humicola]|uniref:serine/threonine-protein kinase n=1 Tax=Aquabacterium humicola TaxID=3237377 RepID=UPI0025436466|nr:serine/threonine-protein kinase [Rubrivivax pictus]
MDIARGDWPRLLELLDGLLDEAPAGQAAALAALQGDDARLRASLTELLAQRATLEREGFLSTLPRLARDEPAACDGGTLGPWQLVRELGRGGMGVVHLATRIDAPTAPPVALKLPFADPLRAAMLAERFARERDILRSLDHPGIAAVRDAGASQGQPWLALEYVDGRPITDEAAARGLAVADRLRLFLQVLDAVGHAHRQLVIHRDIKPANVLVDRQGRVKLLDFGVAKLLGGDGADAPPTALTQFGGRAMTPQYASPEQIAGGALSTATDIYSLGVLLYELLAHRLPYRLARATPGAIEEAILDGGITLPSAGAPPAHRRALRGDVDAIVIKALALRPADRYRSAEAFAEDIRRHLDSRPVAARPAGLGYRIGKQLRRHAWRYAAASVLLGAIGAGMAATVWQMQRAEREAARAGAIKDFLVSVFRAGDPRLLRDRPPGEVTARELLDANAARIETEFKHDPATAIELLGITSEIYGWLLEQQRYDELSARRLALARAHYGERHPLVIDALLTEAWSLIFSQQRDEARRRLDAIDALIGVRAGARSLQAAEWWLAQAQALQAVPGAGDERMRALQRAIELFGRLDADHPSYLAALANAGNEHLKRGEPAAARDRYLQALAAGRRQRQPEAGDLAMTQRNLALALHQLDDQTGAANAFREAERLSRSAGVQLPTHWMVIDEYARFLHRRGEREAAFRLYDETLPLLPTPPGSGATGHDAMLLRSWGEALLAEGRAAQALPPLEAAYRVIVARPDREADRRHAAVLLARALAALGRGEEAQRLFREALDDYARHEPAGAVAACDARVRYAQWLADTGQSPAAAAEFDAVLRAAGERPIAAASLAQMGLAKIALARGDTASARRHGDQALQAAQQLRGAFDLRVQPEVWRDRAALALALGDRAQAQELAARALQASQRLDGESAAASRAARELMHAASSVMR